MRKLVILVFLSIHCIVNAQNLLTPDKIYGRLFHDVQMSGIFKDRKTFPDCVPKKDPAAIVRDYLKIVNNPNIRFSLELFVQTNFELPPVPATNYASKEKDIELHIKNLWTVLKRQSDQQIPGSSLLPLPYPYIVPGGRFREIYYWDSYFTMLGLKQSGEFQTLENMVKNFAYLIDTYGHIPNGNRTYYLSRSQPPFFALMIDLLAAVKGDSVYVNYLPQMEREYLFWMDGNNRLQPGKAFRRVVKLKDNTILNRYYDDSTGPRQESYREDIETAIKSKRNKAEMYRHLRAAAESGWDFSSRWLSDNKNLVTIETTNIIPVDLNCLLYKLELNIARAQKMTGNEAASNDYRNKANRRLSAIDKYCWSSTINFYTDYNIRTLKPTNTITPAGMYPFCLFESKPDYMSLLARRAGRTLSQILLKEGGVLAGTQTTGQQWDAPNGWAPLQLMTVWGLDRCGQKELARTIATRWTTLNRNVFARTGKLMEKYDIINSGLEAGGGEYEGQDGFGWTNGVYLALNVLLAPS
ncbi:MAG: alpha,alpha-trehalase TreA [Chitinophagaceae bacterium]|nr:alpha,alpha-trehalase TreA [Chitinophagaceae bacterium]